LVKGLYMKVPVGAPQLNEIKTLSKSTTLVSKEKLEKLSLSNGMVLDFFVDSWMDFNDLIDNFPEDILKKDDLIIQKKVIEKQDSSYVYFLNITDFLLPGDNAPYEYAKNTIQEVLINQRKIEFLKNVAEDLFQRALDKGEIQFYN